MERDVLRELDEDRWMDRLNIYSINLKYQLFLIKLPGGNNINNSSNIFIGFRNTRQLFTSRV
jgi:hypothetical protein